jgi:hypothetical protein
MRSREFAALEDSAGDHLRPPRKIDATIGANTLVVTGSAKVSASSPWLFDTGGRTHSIFRTSCCGIK